MSLDVAAMQLFTLNLILFMEVSCACVSVSLYEDKRDKHCIVWPRAQYESYLNLTKYFTARCR